MRSNKIKFVLYLILALSVAVYAQSFPQNPNVSSSAGSATKPISTYQRGLVDSQKSYDIPGNRIVTGNVAGGKHFRGVVPYNAITDFGGRLGTGELDSFLRRSAGASQHLGYSPTPIPYYSQTGSVTTTGLDGNILNRAASTKIRTNTHFITDTDAFGTAQQTREFDTSFTNLTSRPLSVPPDEIEKIIRYRALPSKQTSSEQEEQKESSLRIDERYKSEMKEVSEQSQRLQDRLEHQEPSEPDGIFQIIEERQKQVEQKQEKSLQDEEKPGIQKDVFEKMQEDILQLNKTLEELKGLRQQKQQEDGQEKKQEENQTQLSQDEDVFDIKIGPSAESKDQGEKEKAKYFDIDGLSQTEISAEAEKILSGYDSFAAYTDDRFNLNMALAEKYLDEGKYYWAADVYTLASMYKPENPLPHAGRGHALFAAGEYMSSALFIAKALEIYPQYALIKVDLRKMIPDEDRLQSRLQDIQQWYEYARPPEMQFLLAYLYHNLGDPEKAQESVDIAYEKMPESEAVQILKDAIYLSLK